MIYVILCESTICCSACMYSLLVLNLVLLQSAIGHYTFLAFCLHFFCNRHFFPRRGSHLSVSVNLRPHTSSQDLSPGFCPDLRDSLKKTLSEQQAERHVFSPSGLVCTPHTPEP